jgi:hypothetical protein
LANDGQPCLAEEVQPEHLREFASRARDEVAAAKQEHWRTVTQTGDGLAAFDAAQALYEHAVAVSGFPDAAYTADDLSHQLHLKRLIDRASQVAARSRATR